MRPVALQFLVLFVLCAAGPIARGDDGRMVRVTLELNSGGQITGLAGDYDNSRIVVKVGDQLAAVEWDDVKTASAYSARKKILESARGSAQNLTAEDHFQLGYFLAVRNNRAAAVAEFRKAERRDAGFQDRIRAAWREIRRAKERNVKRNSEPIYSQRKDTSSSGTIGRTRQGMAYRTYTEEQHRQAVKTFKHFGETEVRGKIAPDLVLLETRHFLIWTDWPEAKRNLIPDWAEQLYNVMCDEFGFPRNDPIWLGKCPLFCFKNKRRFQKFAKSVDGYDASKALGYTKTTNGGYVHVVLRRLGNRPEDIDKFAVTMVHEASHAFMHNYGSPKDLPPWLNEGLADYIAERVLGDRSPTGENAAALARQYVAQQKPIREVFEFESSPPGHFYPICQSLVEYLIDKDGDAFVAMINDLKGGMDADKALRRHYKGMNLNVLDHSWRTWIKKTSAPG
jgi:hypothetical protein